LSGSALDLEENGVSRSLIHLAMVAAALLAALPAVAMGAPPPNPGSGPTAAEPAKPAKEEVEPGSGTKREAAPDERTGHVYVDGFVSAVGAAGSVAVQTPSSSVAGIGLNAGGTVGVGVSRYVALQAFGEYGLFSSPAVCNAGCSGKSYAVGLGLRFHVAQGIAFDPWGSFGLGFRSATFVVENPTLQSSGASLLTRQYYGMDVGRVAFGGNFYPVPFLGFGPFIEADFGTFLKRPPPLLALPADVANTPTTYALFQIGLRVSFDPMRRGKKAAEPSAARRPAAPGL
jgi:hypothetical protein